MNKRRILWPSLSCILAMAIATASQAAPTDIARAPLTNPSPNTVLPNVMFVLDDSGSMGWDYLPDWAGSTLCRSAGATSISSGSFTRSCTNEPPFRSSDFNGVYYNPAIRYKAPLKSPDYTEATSRPNQTAANTSNWTNVKNDAYGVQSPGTTNLITDYADVEWCTDTTYTDCLRNGNYVLPGTVGLKSYTTRRATTASGSGYIAVGAPDAAKTEARTFGPHYYTIVPAEYCDALNLRNCQASPTAVYKEPAPLRWCDSVTNATAATPAVGSCQALRTNTYTEARYPTKFFTSGTLGTGVVPAVPARTSFDIQLSGQCRSTGNPTRQIALSAVTVNGVNLLGSTGTTLVAAANNLATEIRALINANTPTTGYSADRGNPTANNTVRIFAPATAGDIAYTVTFTRAAGSHAQCTMTQPTTAPRFSGFVAEQPATPGTLGGFPGSFVRVDIVPSVTSYPKGPDRTDCSGASSCSYDEEMTNFANWFTYYRTRMQSMKSSASFAFGNLSDQYRVGYYSINNNTNADFLNLDRFTSTHKDNWFSKLTAARPSQSTPLRVALSTVGRLYGGRLNGNNLNGSTVAEPMQYSCQQNFTLLSTDGYWNENATPTRLDGSPIGEQDSGLARPMRDGGPVGDTLADVAAYYYETDLRTGTATDPLCLSASGADLCENNVFVSAVDVAEHQHMTTFTLGLGVSGYMLFDRNYRTATSGDYFSVKDGAIANPTGGICTWQTSGTCEWPAPVSNGQTTVDDLWHAAVNGRGTYFSAKDPASLYGGLKAALDDIDAIKGAAAAATTSNPNVSQGDNFVFISRYITSDWTGELNGRQIDTDTGAVLETGNADFTPWSTNTTLVNSSRTIYTFSGGSPSQRKEFTWANLSTTERAYFETAHITAAGRALSQFCTFGLTCLIDAAKAAAPGEPLVNYLRGDRTNEGADDQTDKYFRARAHLLGDIVNSEAVYVNKPLFNYADPGYGNFKTSTTVTNRAPMVYVGANDGMLHAFNARTGSEVWAYIPSMLMPKLYRLADKNYSVNHEFFVDSSPVSGDVYINNNWSTILVGGLGAGGRGYYALDVTDPTNPIVLWEFQDNNLGLTFGKPEITKLKNGKWVVIFASGYNNISPGDGRGRLYVLDAATGAPVSTINTGGPAGANGTIETSAGTTTTPSGLAQIRAWVDRTELDNTAQRVYAGDNLGNVWRFDINGDIGATGYEAQLIATLSGSGGLAQPITSRPELGLVNGKAMVYVGTGRYLGTSDVSSNPGPQTIYGIKDSLGTSSLGNPRATGSGFVKQTLTNGTCPTGSTICAPSQTVRLGSSNAVDLNTDNGWYVDLPESREIANTDPQLALGTLVFTTNVIDSSACSVGKSFISFFDYRTGGTVSTSNGVAGVLLSNKALATRPAIVRLPDGKVISLTRLSDDNTVVSRVPVGTVPSATRRISWRELTN